MVINTNIAAQTGATLLGKSSQLLSKSLARLSSGSKIISPADDAAGLAVAMKFGAQIDRTQAAMNNIGNALSFSQTQDGYLSKVSDALSRMSELTVMAQDVTKSASDRSLYNNEFQALSSYVNDVATKDFNGVSLFGGTALNVTTDSEGGTLSAQGISANYVSGSTTTVTNTSTVAYAGSTQLGALSPNLNAQSSGLNIVPEAYIRTFTSSSTINDLVNYFNNSPSGTASATYNSSTGQLSLTVPAGEQIDDFGHFLHDLGLTPTGSGTGAFGADTYAGGGSGTTYSTTLTHSVTTTTTTFSGAMDISTASGAASALTQVKSSISQLASDRATVGATIQRLNFTSSQLGTLKDNLSAATSRITDVDVAQESSNYARYNILIQAGTAMLAQANSQPQSVLRLLG